jgi:hypothetical protein
MAPTLKDEYPDIETFTRFAGFGIEMFYLNMAILNSSRMTFISLTPLSLTYSLQVRSRDTQDALTEPNTIVITESFASPVFREEESYG